MSAAPREPRSAVRALRPTTARGAGVWLRAFWFALAVGSAAGQGLAPDYARDIQPLLARACYACHGPDAAHRAAELRLDTAAGLFEARGDAHAVIVRGDAAASELLERIAATDPSDRMPPPESGPGLNAAEQDLLRRWIEAGAPFKAEHWAFVPPVARPLPAVKTKGYARDPLDLFVLSALEARGLAPAPEADKATLARRAALDLTGLPPDPELAASFLKDERPEAFERYVDQLLDSDAHAEHFARHWLDLARYADTHGLHFDNYREIWPYRDAVIQAFRTNLPYDQFLLRQLAGDLLPRPSQEELVATGFSRCHITTHEGGSIEEEIHVRNVTDRTDTFGTVFMGLSVGCAACHDHKYDPLTQAEYYGLFGFFNSVDGPEMDGNEKAHAPYISVPSPEDARALESLRAEEERIEEAVAVALSERPFPAPGMSPRRKAAERHHWILPRQGGSEIVASLAPEAQGLGSRRLEARGFAREVRWHPERPLCIGPDDRVVVEVSIDPEAAPEAIAFEVLVEGASAGKHRAVFGALEAFAEAERAAALHRPVLLPGPRQTVEIPIRELGLRAGSAVRGLAVIQVGGAVSWEAAWLESSALQEPIALSIIEDGPPKGSLQGDGSIWQFEDAASGPVFRGERALVRRGKSGLHQDFVRFETPIALRAEDRVVVQVWLDPADAPKGIQLQFLTDSWEHRIRYGAPAHGASATGLANVDRGPLPPTGSWQRIVVPIADVGLKPGQLWQGIAFTQVGGTVRWDALELLRYELPEAWTEHEYELWRADAPNDPKLSEELRGFARGQDHERALQAHWLRHIHPETRAYLAPWDGRKHAIQHERKALQQRIPTTLVMRERAQQKPSHRLDRGAYDQPRELTPRNTPAFLPPFGENTPKNRLGLAQWLLREDHPLTARVQVNRIWQWVFGTGLVRTPEDFGRQGEPPMHPELLDWLARRHIEERWDTRRLIRRLVLSATYRQSSTFRADLAELDPDQRLLARAERRRLDAEVLRDQALALGGLLVRQVGGPPVKPPQPEGLWKAVAYVGSNTDRFVADRGPDKVWRRSIYTFWKRTAPPPQMGIFDAPTREACTPRRERSNTPLQALVLLNDPQFVEAARGLAQRALKEGPAGDADKVEWMFRQALQRSAPSGVAAELAAWLDGERKVFREDPARAAALVAVGELARSEAEVTEEATWTLVAQLIMNSDAFLNRE